MTPRLWVDLPMPAAQPRTSQEFLVERYHKYRERRCRLRGASIEYVGCSWVPHHDPDPMAVLREFRRVLRPRGQRWIVVCDYECVYEAWTPAQVWGLSAQADLPGLSFDRRGVPYQGARAVGIDGCYSRQRG